MSRCVNGIPGGRHLFRQARLRGGNELGVLVPESSLGDEYKTGCLIVENSTSETIIYINKLNELFITLGVCLEHI